MNLEGKLDRSSAYVKDETGAFLRNVELIRDSGGSTLSTTPSHPGLTQTSQKAFDQWPENMPPGVQPTMQELTDAIHSLANGKAVGPDGVYAELLKIILNGDLALRRIVFGRGRGAAAVERCHHDGTP